jgi:hypothetical protein
MIAMTNADQSETKSTPTGNAAATQGPWRIPRLGGKILSLFIILGLIFISLCYMILAISVNAGRISHVQRVEGKIQNIANQIAKDPKSTTVTDLQKQINDWNNERDSHLGQIEYGQSDYWGTPMSECAIPLKTRCFHKNDSETNNLFLALASGLIGASLYLLLGIYLQVSARSSEDASNNLMAVVTFLPLGMVVGLLTLFAIKGTKGALLAPVADIVQLADPYGLAFVATLAAFGSVRVLTMVAGLIDLIPNLWKSAPKPGGSGASGSPGGRGSGASGGPGEPGS